MNPDDFQAALDGSPLFQSLGLKVVTLAEDSVCLAIEGTRPTHGGAFGGFAQAGINGAVICAALETAIGLCGYATLGRGPAGVIELSVKLQRLVHKLPCHITAQVDRLGQGLAFVSAVLTNVQNTPCATASGIVLATRRASNRNRPIDQHQQSRHQSLS